MAVVTNTLVTDAGTGIREDLEDVIYDLYAEDTWAMTNLSKSKAAGTYHEYLTDTLVPAGANKQVEGDEASFATIQQPTRIGSTCQIMRKTFIVSATMEAVNKAGRKKEAARQMVKQMREIKQDAEYAIVTNQASEAGGAGTARAMAGMESWLATNEILATSTASSTTAGFSSGSVAAPVDGSTTGALTEGALKSALQAAWTQGGNVTTILTGAAQKNVLDAFTGIATRFVDNGRTQEASIIGAASVYVTSYGTHKIVLHRHIRSSVVLCLDPEYWSLATLRPFSHTKLAQTGDAEKHMIVGEMTLCSRNEAASAKVVACA